MRDVDLKYDVIEKQAYALVQAFKAFRIYVLHYPLISYVTNNEIKTVLTQPNTDGKRGRWIAKMLEFDLDITTTKLVKGQGLAKMLTESNFQALGINLLTPMDEKVAEESEGKQDPGMKIRYKFLCSEWYKHIIHYLCFLSCPQSLEQSIEH